MSNSIMEIDRDHSLYPERMKALPGMPQKLYVLGSLPRDDIPTVGIVGARLCSPYGHRTAYHLARELALRGVQIISGMAAGIDGYAAEGALDAGAPSFAVLGNGVDICYPPGNRSLYDRMIAAGGLISE
jgi:DNA processing protein